MLSGGGRKFGVDADELNLGESDAPLWCLLLGGSFGDEADAPMLCDARIPKLDRLLVRRGMSGVSTFFARSPPLTVELLLERSDRVLWDGTADGTHRGIK